MLTVSLYLSQCSADRCLYDSTLHFLIIVIALPVACMAVRKQLCMSVPQLSRASDFFPFCLASASVRRATSLRLCTMPDITGTSQASLSSLNSCRYAKGSQKVAPRPGLMLSIH